MSSNQRHDDCHRAWQLKQDGKTFTQIAVELGYVNDSGQPRRGKVARMVADYGAWLARRVEYGAANVEPNIIEDDLYYPSARDINDNDEWADYLKFATKRGKMLKIMFWADMHYKDESKQAVGLARQLRRYIKPDVDFFLGDEFDLDTLSTHWARGENRRRVDAFKEVMPDWYGLHDALDDDLKGVQRVMLGGNHTRGRVENYVNERAPELADTIVEGFISLARANNRVKWLGWEDSTWINNYHIEHGTRTGENSSKNSLKDVGWASPRTGGHVHAPSEAFNHIYVPGSNLLYPNRIIVHSVTLPCLCNIHAHYFADKKKSRWINGVGVAYVNLNGLDVHQHKVIFHSRQDGSMVGAFGSEVFVQQAAVSAMRKAG